MAIAMRYGVQDKNSEDSAGTRQILLWENASPTSNFAAQTVSLGLSGYDEIKITFIANISSPISYTQIFENDIYSHFMFTVTAGGARQARQMTFAADGITFAAGMTGSTNNNQYCVPLKIYGVRY